MAKWNFFNSSEDTITSPASAAEAITTSDSVALTESTRAIYVGGAGDITCRLIDDTNDTVFKAVPQGTILPIRATFVRATGTTATLLVAMR